MSVVFFNETIAELFKIVEDTPNDKELGKKIRGPGYALLMGKLRIL